MAWERVALVAGGMAVLVGLGVLLWPLARHRFIYPGGRLAPAMADPALHGLPRSEQVWLEADDGVRIHAWWTPSGHAGGATGDAASDDGPAGSGPDGRGARGAVIYCHGNAESLATRAWIAEQLAGMGLDVLLFDYRGYGLSEGRPSEEGLARDARAAWRHVVEARGVAPDRVVLMGHSLGSAVATRLALELDDEPAGLVVGAPFPDMPALFRHHAPWLPGWALPRRADRHAAGSRLGEVDVPLLVVVGSEDEVIPPELSRGVYPAAKEAAADGVTIVDDGAGRVDSSDRDPGSIALVTVPADHATVMGHPDTWAALESFLESALAPRP